VQFAVPRSATNAATLMPGGLHWLRATVRRHAGAIPKTVAVLAQAAQASFRDNGNDPRHLEHPLPAGTITKLIDRQAAIKSVSQPFSSFGPRVAESDAAFRVRVAERLRHKRRAVTLFDYERLVLERFPEVYKVRCLTHTSGDSEYAPGAVRVVVVPNLRNRNAVDPLRPRLSLSRLEEIRRDLRGMASDFADIHVVNPDYEEVRVRLNVRFGRGFDEGHYAGQLEQDIIRFLSPWLHDDGVDLAFGGRVHRSAVLNFIDEREYVDFVADFEMDHIIPATAAAPGQTRVHVEEAQPTRSSAVIVPARTHAIGHDIVSCSDEPGAGGAPPAPGPAGPAPLPPGVARYLGNVRTRELHDRLNITPYCQIDEIAIDRRFSFRRIEQAEALGYDFCAYCFGRARSQR
jgi:Baseplate J-like protein